MDHGLQEAPQPVIAAVEGAAMGGGFSVCLACDLIVAAEDARFAMSYVNMGLSPDAGGTDSLARALPPQAALEMLLTGTPSAPSACKAGAWSTRWCPAARRMAQRSPGRRNWRAARSRRRRASSNWCTARADAPGANSWTPNVNPS
jgi:enoyl-CoA hydratase/carnithine racemase